MSERYIKRTKKGKGRKKKQIVKDTKSLLMELDPIRTLGTFLILSELDKRIKEKENKDERKKRE